MRSALSESCSTLSAVARFVQVLLLDIDKVHNVIGCSDDAVCQFVTDRRSAEFTSDAEHLAWYGDDRIPKLEDALRTVIAGGPYDDDYPHRYNLAYREICEAFAMWRSGHGPYRGDWLWEVDGGFRALGVDAIAFTEFEHMTPGNLPIDMDGGYGEWTHEQCVRAVAQWDSSDPEKLANLDPRVREWVESGINFASVAANSPGLGIGGFFTI